VNEKAQAHLMNAARILSREPRTQGALAVATVFTVEPGHHSHSAYRYDDKGPEFFFLEAAEAFTAEMLEMRSAAQIPGDKAWISCLLQLKANGKLACDFEYEDVHRWAVRPATFEQDVARLRPPDVEPPQSAPPSGFGQPPGGGAPAPIGPPPGGDGGLAPPPGPPPGGGAGFGSLPGGGAGFGPPPGGPGVPMGGGPMGGGGENNLALVSVVSGSVSAGSLLCCCIPVLGYLAWLVVPFAGVVAVVTGVLGLKEANETGVRKNEAIAGIALGSVGIVLFVVVILLVLFAGVGAGLFGALQPR
jgi:hypothetical protein